MALLPRFEGFYKATFVLTGNNQCIRTTAGAMVGDRFSTPTGGLTTDYQQAGSTAYFNMLPNSKVIYAELLWTAFEIGDTVEFITPVKTYTVTKETTETGGWTSNMANVTDIIKEGGSGKYECNKIKGSMGTVGWFLTIVYENQNFPLRYLSYVAGAVNDGSATIILDNIYTPKNGPVKANIFAGAYGSDLPDRAAIRVGPTVANLTQVGNPTPLGTAWNGQKPYNPKFAFLSNIICNCDPQDTNYSLLDTRGTFGSPNPDPYFDQNPANSRAWMDIGSMDISSIMQNNQTTLVARSLITGSGWFTQNLFALQVDVNSAVLEIVKHVDKETGDPGEELIYTFTITNVGAEESSKSIIVDTLPSNAVFVANSVTIDGSSSSDNPQIGINIGTVKPLEVKTVTFKATIATSAQKDDVIKNSSFIGYNYTPSNSIPSQYASSISNTVATTVTYNLIIGELLKSVNLNAATTGDTLIYTITIPNIGKIEAYNVIFYDTVPANTTLVPNSILVNGNSISGTINNTTGLEIGTLPANMVTTINFSVKIQDNLPVKTPILNSSRLTFRGAGGVNETKYSNTVSTVVKKIVLASKKYVNDDYVMLGTTITYTITITNNGNITAENISFYDTLPNGTTLVQNSFMQDSVVIQNFPREAPITLPNSIGPNQTSTITFLVKSSIVPKPNPITNSATAYLAYLIDGESVPERIAFTNTNTNTVSTFIANIETLVTKYTDKIYADYGDTLTYTIVISNKGNIKSSNLFFQDTTPNGVTLVLNSVYINGTHMIGANPQLGIVLDTINPNEAITIAYNVRVNY